MKYWLQTQAPAGNWADSVGSEKLDVLRKHGAYMEKQGATVRIVSRTDKVISDKSQRIKRNPRGTLAAHAAAVNPKRVSANAGRKPRKRAIAVDYVELRDSTGKVYGRFNSRHTTMADIKAMARIIAQQHGIAVSAHRVKR